MIQVDFPSFFRIMSPDQDMEVKGTLLYMYIYAPLNSYFVTCHLYIKAKATIDVSNGQLKLNFFN
jgi:hypothetical protein